ncbi:hypothetical protein PG993_011463 [Apiospora rasikravindrae]|uniref:Uncharacterized protein n=1 Tax=Apiospora rasikravindrae TaxID=990691 RepID=A0ABR1SEB0_9PEZI
MGTDVVGQSRGSGNVVVKKIDQADVAASSHSQVVAIEGFEGNQVGAKGDALHFNGDLSAGVHQGEVDGTACTAMTLSGGGLDELFGVGVEYVATVDEDIVAVDCVSQLAWKAEERASRQGHGE